MGKSVFVDVWYKGRRFLEVAGRISHVFIDDKGKEYNYKKIKFADVGGKYAVEKSEKHFLIDVLPKRIGNELHPKREQWSSADWAAYEKNREYKLSRRLAKMTDLKNEIPRISRFTKTLGWSEKNYFINWLISELEK